MDDEKARARDWLLVDPDSGNDSQVACIIIDGQVVNLPPGFKVRIRPCSEGNDHLAVVTDDHASADFAGRLEIAAAMGKQVIFVHARLEARPKTPSAALSSASAQSRNRTYAPSPRRSSALHPGLWAAFSNFDRPGHFSAGLLDSDELQRIIEFIEADKPDWHEEISDVKRWTVYPFRCDCQNNGNGQKTGLFSLSLM